MSVSSSDIRGRVFWHELHTSDVAAAKAFYGAVVGWGIQGEDMGGFVYEMFTLADGTTVGGVMNPAEMPGGQAVHPHWLAYFGTPDVDATVVRARELGATVLSPAMDIPGIGRFAVIADPQGAVFAAFTPAQVGPEPDPHTPGVFSWSELYTTDVEAAWGFYLELFGWAKTGSMDMGPEMGEYRMFGRSAEKSNGGIMKKAAQDPSPPHWQYYVTVPDIHGALARTRELGGQVLWGPQEVPGNDLVATCTDPQGAVFAVYQAGATRA